LFGIVENVIKGYRELIIRKNKMNGGFELVSV